MGHLGRWVLSTFTRSSSCILSQEIWQADMVLGGDTTYPADHSLVIVLQAMQVRYGRWHAAWGCTNYKLFLRRWWEVGGRFGCTGAHWICPMQHSILQWKQVHNCQLRISSPQGNRRMAPPQASPYPLWPATGLPSIDLACQYVVYTWSWDWASESERYRYICCGLNWSNLHRKWSLCWRPWDTRHRGLLCGFLVS